MIKELQVEEKIDKVGNKNSFTFPLEINLLESPSHRNIESSSLTRKAVGDVADVHSTATLGRRKSRIPTAAKHHQNRMNRTVSDGDLGTESVDERLETLLHLLGGSRHGTIGNR